MNPLLLYSWVREMEHRSTFSMLCRWLQERKNFRKLCFFNDIFYS